MIWYKLFFSHFSYEFSSCKILVCNIEGIDKIITDSVIISKSEIFGNYDFGEIGFNCFFENHTCNDFCYHLNLNKYYQKIERSLSESFEFD